MKRGIQCLTAGLVFHVMTGTANAVDTQQLQRSVWTLASLQDAAANGDVAAARLQGRLITQIESDVRRLPDDMLGEPLNLQALATLLLSGGNPNVVEAHTLNLKMDDNVRNLISGALAYARADREGAAELLAKVDISHLPPSLAGRVALVRSIIGASENPLAAIDDLHQARQLMPGTLVEEASLRRCIAFAGRLADMERLRFCSGRYMRRFPKSVYWQEFEDSFALAVAQSGLGEGESFEALLKSTERLPTAKQRLLLLRLAYAALTHGRLQLATALAQRAADLSIAGSAEMQRARLYRAAAELVDDNAGDTESKLAAVDRSLLDVKDVALLDRALLLLHQISSEPKLNMDQAKMIAFQANPAPRDEEIDKSIAAARAALAKAGKLAPAMNEGQTGG